MANLPPYTGNESGGIFIRGASLKASALQILEPACGESRPEPLAVLALAALLRGVQVAAWGQKHVSPQGCPTSHHPELREATAPEPSALSLAAGCADSLPATGSSQEGTPGDLDSSST
ncbi:hypothetical protein MC885_014743 [Smutsia gigantea]|nr:hypothetical protein MC885_014743 [Smutsia gigantea]